MSFIIALVIIYLDTIALSLKLKKRFELILPMITAGSSLTLYLFGLIDLRSIGVAAFTASGLSALIYLLANLRKRWAELLDIIKSPGFIFFVVISIFICYISKGFLFTSWDEFSHWGLIQNNIFNTNNFGNLNNTTTVFRGYPPAISLFSIAFNSFSKVFNESYALRGVLLLAFSQMIIIFSLIKNRDYIKLLIISAILVAIPLIFYDVFYSTIYVDAVMGLIFGNILFFSRLYKKRDLFYAVYMSLQFYLLTNTKQIGIFLAATAFVISLVDILLRNKETTKTSSIQERSKCLIYTSIPMMSSVLAALSWKAYLKIHGVLASQFQLSAIRLSDILGLFNGTLPEYRHTVIINFLKSFFEMKEYGIFHLSYFTFLIAVLLILFTAFKLKQDDKKDLSPAHPVLSALGFLPYAGVILFMYLFSFSQYEATLLASEARYFGSYLLGLTILCVFVIIDLSVSNKSLVKNKLSNATIGLLFLITFSMISPTALLQDSIFSRTSNASKQSQRSSYSEILKYKSLLDTSKKVYFISQNDTGYSYWITRYLINPTTMSSSGWSLGSPYYDGDIWTVKKTADEWQEELHNYDYVYLFNIDSKFLEVYSGLFTDKTKITSRQLYIINKANGQPMLEKAKM